jgi:eukaryotic-like serine/threonine-protein kinase
VTLRLAPGTLLDRYELLCPIAHGGMAAVWLARFSGKFGFEKLVAIKTILGEHSADPKFQQMFLDEARIVAQVRHPNVAEILDLGEQDGVVYHVLEWVDGESLARLNRPFRRSGTQFPPRIALRILADACHGLHAAHEIRGPDGKPLDVVHRDVSPSNILVSSTGGVKVIDFGVAKALYRMSETTTSGLVKGKLFYMSPEQALAKPIDRRADVWSIGAVLYLLLSGRYPYEVDNPIALVSLLAHNQAPPSLTDVPEPIAEVLRRSLSISPDYRFPTAAAQARAIEDAAARSYGITTSADVASFVEECLGQELAERKRTIEQAIAKSTRASLSGEEVPSQSHSAVPAAAAISASAGTLDEIPPARPDPPTLSTQMSLRTVVSRLSASPQARSRLMLGALGGTLAFVAIVLFAVVVGRVLQRPKPAASPPPPAPSAAEPPVVELTPAPPPEEPTAVDLSELPGSEGPVAKPQPEAPAEPDATKPKPAPSPAKPIVKQTVCNPNYYFDEKRIKRFKPECFKK